MVNYNIQYRPGRTATEEERTMSFQPRCHEVVFDVLGLTAGGTGGGV